MSEAPTKPCGAYNGEVFYCINSQECFAAPESPICSDVTDVNYSWKLNANVFPPIEYIGNRIGLKQKDRCELFNYGAWTTENIEWLLTFFYQNWDSSNSTTLPLGSFVRPLDHIGSCVEGLYCDNAGGVNKRCKKKHINPEFVCNSTNQCLSQLCGTQGVTKPIDGEIFFTGNCINDGYIAYNQLKGNRPFNVLQNSANDDNNNNNDNNNDNNNNSRSSSGSMAVVIIIIVILFASMAIYGYARRMFKKRDSMNDDSRFLRREIDPETGEIVTVNTLSGRVRRGASILLNRAGSLNRSNSIRTLPPYSVVDEDHPPSSNGIVNSITQYFFPPGELPPPYDSVTGNADTNTNNNDNPTHDVTLDEVREGVTIEGNSNNNNNDDDDNNNNDNNNSTPPSRRSSLASTSRREVDDPRELNTISVISIDSEIDKEGGGGEGEEGTDTVGLVNKEGGGEGEGGSDTAGLTDNPT